MWKFFFVIPSLVFAFTPPPNDGFLTDGAAVLTGEEELRIEGILKDYAEQTGTEIAVIIVRTLDGTSIDDAARDLAERWRIGIAGEGRGIVLLFSSEDRDIFMVIGDGLKGVLSPDVAQGIIARDIIAPLRDDRYAKGIEEGVLSIMKHISGEFTSDRYASSPSSPFVLWLTSIVGTLGIAIMLMLVRGWWGGAGTHRRRRSCHGSLGSP